MTNLSILLYLAVNHFIFVSSLFLTFATENYSRIFKFQMHDASLCNFYICKYFEGMLNI